jgi:hypothetical protein
MAVSHDMHRHVNRHLTRSFDVQCQRIEVRAIIEQRSSGRLFADSVHTAFDEGRLLQRMSSGGVCTEHLSSSFLQRGVHRKRIHGQRHPDRVIPLGQNLPLDDRFLGIDDVAWAKNPHVNRSCENPFERCRR